jgi:hypothetical protein
VKPDVLNAIRRFLVLWVELKFTLVAPPSPTGRLLELARLGVHGAIVDENGRRFESTRDEYGRQDSANRRMSDYAHAECVMAKLEQLERLVLVASVLPIGYVTVEQWAWISDLKPVYVPLYELERGQCRAPTSTGHPCRLQRLFGEARCHLHKEVTSRPVTFVAPDGAVATDGAQALDPRAIRDTTNLEDDPRRTRVIRSAPIYAQPTYIAELLELTPWQVREAGRTGRAKLFHTLLEEESR